MHFGLRFTDEVLSARRSVAELLERVEDGVARVIGMWARDVPSWQWEQWGELLGRVRKRLARIAKVARARHEQDVREAARMLHLGPARWRLEAVETELISVSLFTVTFCANPANDLTCPPSYIII